MKPKFKLRSFLLGYALISTSTVFGGTLTWDNGASTGNWNTTDLNWSGAAPWSNATPDDAVFGATGVGTVTLTEAISAGGITINTAGYTITGNTISLSGGATALTSNATSDINSNIIISTSAGTITSTAGTLTLGGTLDADSLALTFAGAGNTTVSNGITNGTTLTKTDAGTLILGGSNNYSGTTTISGGILQAGSNTGLSQSSDISIASGTRLVLGGFSNTIGTLTGTGGVVENANATGATLTIGNTNASGAYSSSLQDGTGGGALAVIKTGTGAQAITNATFTGGLSINQGTWQLGGINGLGNGPVTINGGALSSNSTNARTLTNTANALAINGSFTLGDATNTGALTLPGAVTLSSNPVITVPTGNSHILSGNIGGSSSLTKAGAGTLTLSGINNTYNGGTTLNGGTVVIGNDTSFGTGSVSVTGASRINISASTSPTNAIDVGAGLTLQLPQTSAATRTATFSGQLTGSSPISVIATGFNGANGTYAFTNTNNTFTGDVIMPAGTTASSPTASGNDFFTFNSIGDAGTFTFRKRGHTNGIIYTGASAITFGTRQIAFGADFGGIFDGGGVNPVNRLLNNATDPNHTVTFNTNITPGTIFQAGTFFFAGSNTGNNTFSGVISNPSNFNLGIGKADAGRWILTGASTYLGNVLIANGTLSVNAIDVAANAQPLGKSSIIQLGNSSTSGTLEYTGSANAGTDKQILLGNPTNNNQTGAGGIANNSPTGTLTFSNPDFNSTTGVTVTTVDRTLTLGGSNTGANTISGVIRDHVAGAAQIILNKTGAGTWVLSNTANTYTGATTISGGILNVAALAAGGSNSSIGAAAVANTNLVLNGGTLQYTGSAATSTNRIFSVGTNGATFDASGTGTGTLSFTGTTAIGYNSQTTARTITLTGSNTGANTMSVIIGNNTGLTSLTKSGTGTWVLNGANTYTGTTSVNEGTLRVSGGSAIANAGVVSIADVAGATFQVVGSETIAALTGGGATGGAVTIDASQTLTLSAGGGNTYAGTVGGAGALTLSGGNQTLNGVVSNSGGINVNSTAATLTLGNPANSYTGVTAIGGGTNRVVLVTADGALGAVGTGNETIITAAAGATGARLALSGGINYTAAETVRGAGYGDNRGFIQSASGSNTFAGNIELNADGISRIGTQDSASLTLTGSITQASGITTASLLFRTGSAGGEFVTLSNAGNSFGGDSGIFNIATSGNWAGVRIGVDNALPTNLTISATVAGTGTGTALDLNGKSQTLNGLISGVSGTALMSIINLDTVNASTLTLNPTADKTADNTTLILGGGGLGTINVVKTGTFTQTLSGSHTYTGTTAINGGTLVITGANQATSAITFGGGVLGLDVASPVTAASATVDFTGQTVLVTGTPTLASYTLLTASSITGTPTLAVPIPGYTLVADSTTLKLNSTGVSGFAAWQAANSTTGGLGEDHDNDGVDNGLEWFLGGNNPTTGFTALPAIANTGGILSVTWPRHPDYPGFPGNYGTAFVVETSTTLTGPWTQEDVPPTPGANVTITGDNVTYTFPGGPAYTGKNFARLRVTGP